MCEAAAYSLSEKRFIATNLFTIIALFMVILAGGIVRSSGSGMGCPDWPTCFGRYIPPSDISQLPVDYQSKYVAVRMSKNERFAKILDIFGYKEMAYHIRNDKNILQPEKFNSIKTWTEYVNRVIGAICGLLILGSLVSSVHYIKSCKKIVYLSFLNTLLIVFQAGLGSLVVSTKLLSGIVTVHMLLALVILTISIYTYFLARSLRRKRVLINRFNLFLRLLSIAAVLLTTVQVIFGAQVREQIDIIASTMNHLNRSTWIFKVGINFNLHRNLAVLLILINICLFLMIRRCYLAGSSPLKFIIYILFILVLQTIAGFFLSRFALPPIAQAVHIVLASLLFGAQIYLMLLLRPNESV